MSDILKIIQEATEPPRDSPELIQKRNALDPYYNAIQEAFGLDFVDHFCTAITDACWLETEEAFSRGFRTGAQVMLEVLSKYSS